MWSAILTFLGWLGTKLFGGDKTANLAEDKGQLEAQNYASTQELDDARLAQATQDGVSKLSDADVRMRLHGWDRGDETLD